MKKEIYRHDKVVLRSWDPETKKYFAKEKARLLKTLGKAFEIHHIGSTAVPGLGGKNIVDMILLAPDKKTAYSVVKILESMEYYHNKDAGDEYRIFFNCNRDFKGQKIHMHLNVMWKTSNKYKDYLMFRDYLRKHPEEAKRYYLLKKLWAKKAKNIREKYTEMKGDYVKEVLKKAKLE